MRPECAIGVCLKPNDQFVPSLMEVFSLLGTLLNTLMIVFINTLTSQPAPFDAAGLLHIASPCSVDYSVLEQRNVLSFLCTV